MLEAEMIDDRAGLADLAPAWDALAVAAGLPQMAPAWVLAWWRHLAPPQAEPRTVVVRERGTVVGVAPFFVEDRGHGRVDYRLPNIASHARLAPLARPGHEWDVAAAVAGALDAARPRPDLVALEGGPLASPWPVALRDGWPGRLRPPLRQYHVHGAPSISLCEPSFEAWLAGRSSNFRGQMRRLRRAFAAAGGTARASTLETLEADVATFVRLHAARWDGRGASNLVGFGERLAPMLGDAGRRLLPDERFRLRLLEIDGEPVSAQLFLAAGGQVLYFNSGWDERHAKLKPSMVGLLAAVEEGFACGDRHIDLGLGEESYKLRFADGNDPVAWSVLLVPGRRLPLTGARIAPTLAGSALREAAKRALTPQQAERARALRARLRRG